MLYKEMSMELTNYGIEPQFYYLVAITVAT